MLKKCVLSSFLNMAGLAAARTSGGSEFHAAGPACEKERSPNLDSQPWCHVLAAGSRSQASTCCILSTDSAVSGTGSKWTTPVNEGQGLVVRY